MCTVPRKRGCREPIIMVWYCEPALAVREADMEKKPGIWRSLVLIGQGGRSVRVLVVVVGMGEEEVVRTPYARVPRPLITCSNIPSGSPTTSRFPLFFSTMSFSCLSTEGACYSALSKEATYSTLLSTSAACCSDNSRALSNGKREKAETTEDRRLRCSSWLRGRLFDLCEETGQGDLIGG